MGAQQAHQAIAPRGGGQRRVRPVRAADPRRQLQQRQVCGHGIGFKRSRPGNGAGVHIGFPRVDQRMEHSRRQRVCIGGPRQRAQDFMMELRVGTQGFIDGLPPPLQADTAQRRVGDDFARARDLVIERV